MFEGDISAEEEVLDWLIEMKVESHIELIMRAMLETMVEDVQYLAVYFCEIDDRPRQIRHELIPQSQFHSPFS